MPTIHPHPDDFEGWQFFEIPFDSFTRKDIGNGAPNDGLNLEIWGHQFILPEGTFYLDKLRLVSAE
ncbi:MAG TPA: hypothetical protein VI451_08690 [Anaerolineales bacterium]|nr:hypothetical protein [Anaerolineales bacterium]